MAKEKQRKNRELKKKVIKKDNVNSERRIQKESDIESDLQLLAIDEQIMSDESDDAICPTCGIYYSADDDLWVECDGCGKWFDFKCTKIKSRRCIPKSYYCDLCT